MSHRDPPRLRSQEVWRQVLTSAAEDEPTEIELKVVSAGLPLRASFSFFKTVGMKGIGLGVLCGLTVLALHHEQPPEQKQELPMAFVSLSSKEVPIDAGTNFPAPVMSAQKQRRREPVVQTSQQSPVDAGTDELLLVDEAFRVLRAGNAEGALTLALRHQAVFPDGTFAQERERIIIEALVATERVSEAHERMSNFVAVFPTSSLRERIEDLVRTAETRRPPDSGIQ